MEKSPSFHTNSHHFHYHLTSLLVGSDVIRYGIDLPLSLLEQRGIWQTDVVWLKISHSTSVCSNLVDYRTPVFASTSDPSSLVLKYTFSGSPYPVVKLVRQCCLYPVLALLPRWPTTSEPFLILAVDAEGNFTLLTQHFLSVNEKGLNSIELFVFFHFYIDQGVFLVVSLRFVEVGIVGSERIR